MAELPGTTAEQLAVAHARLMADRTIQHGLPDAVIPAAPHWLIALAKTIGAAWPVLRVLVWIALAAALLMLLWMVGQRLLGLRWPGAAHASADQGDTPAWQPDAGAARALLREADALAAAGRYGEAVRLVLHRSIEDVERHRPVLVRPATTSRDLASLGTLPEAAGVAFAAIASVVERSLFADRGADRHAWDEARDAYARFARVEQW